MHIVFFLYLKDVWIKDISEISRNVKQELSLFVVVVVGQSHSLVYFKKGHAMKLPVKFH